MKKYKVRIECDQDTESPLDNDGAWSIYSFNSRHNNFKHPDEFFEGGKLKLAIRNKMRVGLAHILSYYEHGNCVWSLQGDGPQCRFDTAQVAGIAIWEHNPNDMGAKTAQDRARDCANCLEEYTQWCNGECYWFSIDKVEICGECHHASEGDNIDSCGGFIGATWLADCLRGAMPEDANEENTEIVGDAKWIAEYNDIFPVAKVTA